MYLLGTGVHGNCKEEVQTKESYRGTCQEKTKIKAEKPKNS